MVKNLPDHCSEGTNDKISHFGKSLGFFLTSIVLNQMFYDQKNLHRIQSAFKVMHLNELQNPKIGEPANLK